MSRYDLDRDEIAELLADLPRYRAVQLWEGLYRGLADPAELRVLPGVLRERSSWNLPSRPACTASNTSSRRRRDDASSGFSPLPTGTAIEPVLMHNPRHSTVCVSSQAGCAMACTFCATGDAGFARHLSTGEIVEQVVLAAPGRQAAGRRLDHVVFMGMGEPLANFDHVWRAIERIIDDIGIAARHVTVSTVGVIPGIRKLAESQRQVNLAVSLHAANDALRDSLVPLNRRYPLDELLGACADYVGATHRRISFEWALIDGVNDTDDDADELAVDRARGARPRQPHPAQPDARRDGARPRRVAAGPGSSPSSAGSTRRPSTPPCAGRRGRTIDAACGQLAALRRDGPTRQPGAGSTASRRPDPRTGGEGAAARRAWDRQGEASAGRCDPLGPGRLRSDLPNEGARVAPLRRCRPRPSRRVGADRRGGARRPARARCRRSRPGSTIRRRSSIPKTAAPKTMSANVLQGRDRSRHHKG